MNPSQEKALKEHIQEIAKILYEQTGPEQLKDLETIEATVHQHLTKYVSPELGVFLSKKRQEQAKEYPSSLKPSPNAVSMEEKSA